MFTPNHKIDSQQFLRYGS